MSSVDPEIDNTNEEDAVIIPKTRNINSLINSFNELNQKGLIKPDVELNKKENKSLVELNKIDSGSSLVELNKRESKSLVELSNKDNYSSNDFNKKESKPSDEINEKKNNSLTKLNKNQSKSSVELSKQESHSLVELNKNIKNSLNDINIRESNSLIDLIKEENSSLIELNKNDNNPSLELDNNENSSSGGYTHSKESSEYESIHFSNYSNTLRKTTARLLKPHLCSLSEFKLMDLHPQQQRLTLYLLRKQEIRLMNEGIMKPLSKDEMKIKKKATSEPKDKTRTGNSFTRFLLKKKSKHSSSETFHLLQLAIHDNRISAASTLLNSITYGNMKKKRLQEINKAFLLAMMKKFEDISVMFLNKGFPENVNCSIFDVSLNLTKKQKKNNTLQFPSYFILAVSLGLMDVIKVMIKKAIVNLSWFGLTPLILACAQNNLPLVQLLLSNGANPNLGIPLEQYNSLCEFKIKYNDDKKEQWKLECPIFKGSEFQRQWGEHSFLPINKKYFRSTILYPIDIACMMNNLEIVRLLLTCMGVAGVPNDTLALKIHYNLETTILLLKAGAIPSKDPRGNTPLHIAARIGDEKLAVLYSRFFAIDSLGQNNWTPLHEAISRKNINICRFLISKGSSLDKRTSSGYTPLELAHKCGFTKEEVNELYAPPGNPLDNLTIKEVEILDLLEANGIKILRPIHINIPLPASRKNLKAGSSPDQSSSSSIKKKSPLSKFFKRWTTKN